MSLLIAYYRGNLERWLPNIAAFLEEDNWTSNRFVVVNESTAVKCFSNFM